MFKMLSLGFALLICLVFPPTAVFLVPFLFWYALRKREHASELKRQRKVFEAEMAAERRRRAVRRAF